MGEKIESELLDILKSLREKEDNSLKFKEIIRENLNLHYYGLFLSELTSKLLFDFCERTLEYPDRKLNIGNKWIPIPRKQIAFGDNGLYYEFSGNSLKANPWNKVMYELKSYISDIVGVDFNFVMINRYEDGTNCIHPHKDRDDHLDPKACIASLSIGECRDFILEHESNHKKSTKDGPSDEIITLENGSLLLINPPTNKYWYHSVPRQKNKETRINFTFRKFIKK